MALFKGIKVKMTVANIAGVLAAVVALTTVTYVLVSYSLGESLKSRAIEISKILTEALQGRERQLAIHAEVTTQDRDFQTSFAFREDEQERLRKDIGDRLDKIGASLAIVDDLNGKEASAVQRVSNVNASLLNDSLAMKS